jgi:hypothetical protein
MAGVLVPEHLTAEKPARDDVGVAVAVDIQNQIGEVVEILQLVLDLAERVFLPAPQGIVGRLVPVLAADHAQVAAAIDVHHAGRLALAVGVDDDFLKAYFVASSANRGGGQSPQ